MNYIHSKSVGLNRNNSFKRVYKNITVNVILDLLGPHCQFEHNLVYFMDSRELPHLFHLGFHNYSFLQQHKAVKKMVSVHFYVVIMTTPGLWKASTVSLSSYT